MTGVKDLVDSIQHLKKSDIAPRIAEKLHRFQLLRESSNDELFKELCFCILAANFKAESTIGIQDILGDCFLTYSEDELKEKFRKLGYRFPNIRASYILEARSCLSELERKLNSNIDEYDLRDWVAAEIKGLGYKEASHFLRNIGYPNYAIIDFHIIDLLEKHNIIERPKTLTKKKYLEIETVLKDLGDKLNLNLDKLDLYLWYLETNEILK